MLPQVRDADTVKGELLKMLEVVRSGVELDREWMQVQWDRTEVIAKQATSLSSQFQAVNKLARYIQLRGELWRAAYETQQEWIGDLTVNEGMSRSALFAVCSDIDMAIRAGLSHEEVFDLIAAAPTALRDAREKWLNEFGEFREDLNLPDGGVKSALQTMSTLSPSEARAYASFDVRREWQRFMKDAAYIDNSLLLKMIVRPDEGPDYTIDLKVEPVGGEEFTFDDAAWLSRRTGKELVVNGGLPAPETERTEPQVSETPV